MTNNPNARARDADARFDARRDAQLDANLKRLAAHLPLPAPASAKQRASWFAHAASHESMLNCTARHVAPTSKKDRYMLNLRLFTAGSLAAAVAVCAFLLGPLQPQRVHAAQIIETLRTSAWQALRIKMENVDADGILVNAEVEIRFCQPTTLAKLINTAQHDAFSTHCDSSNPLEQIATTIESVYFDASVNAGPNAEPDAVGLDLVTRGGVSFPSSAWFYVQPRALPAQLLREAPAAGFITMMFGHGVLLDLPDLDALMNQMGGDAEDKDNVEQSTSVSVQAEARDNTLEISAEIDDQPKPDNQLHVRLGADSDEAPPELIQRILTGGASASDFEQLLSEADSGALNFDIEERGAELSVLTIRDFAQEDEMLENAVVEIGYRQHSGIEWLTVMNVGSQHGTIRVEFTTPTYDKAANIRADMIADGVQVMNVNQIADLLQQQVTSWSKESSKVKEQETE